jgi:TetR/AcrR family transcriptional regulator, regulator of autoinduction and epiphytic fitness
MRIIEAPPPTQDPSSSAILVGAVLADPARSVQAAKKSFKQIQFESRELAILEATNRLLSLKGYEQMVMDDIAAEVGIAKGSLYRHFQSKEDLAAAVMLQLLNQTHVKLGSFADGRSPLLQLEALLDWILRARLKGQVPHLPSASIQLREALMGNKAYMNTLVNLSEDLGELIVRAKNEGSINSKLADEFVLYHFYSRACDPTLEYLKSGGSMTEEAIIDSMIRVTFDGLRAPK